VAVPEVEVPLWKKPAGMAIGGVAVLVLAAGLYFGFSGGTDTGTGPTDATTQQSDQPEQPPPPSPAEQQQSLIDEAQKLADAGNYNGALGKLSQAEGIQGPLGSRIGQLRTQINEEVQNAGVRQIRQQEAQLWTQAEGHLNANRFDQAQRGFQQVLDLPQGGRRRADAQRFIREVIPQRRQEQSLMSQAQTAAQQSSNEGRLQEADRLLGQVIGMNGPRLQEAQQLQTTVRQRLDELAQQAAAADRQQQVAALKNNIRQDLQRGNYQAARQKVGQITRLQGDTQDVTGEINRAVQQKFSQLEGQFRRAQQGKNKSALEGLWPEFRKLAQAGGPVASQARNYADTRIPQALSDLEAAAQPPAPSPPSVRRVSCTVLPVTAARYDRPVRGGSPMGQKFIDGGVVLQSASRGSCGLPASLFQGRGENNQVMIMVNIDQNGRVSGGRVLTGQADMGQSILQAAQQSWQFNPPKVNGTAVTTTASVTVKF
jgi:TonB family protein